MPLKKRKFLYYELSALLAKQMPDAGFVYWFESLSSIKHPVSSIVVQQKTRDFNNVQKAPKTSLYRVTIVVVHCSCNSIEFIFYPLAIHLLALYINIAGN